MQEIVVTIEDGQVIEVKIPEGILLRIVDRDWDNPDLGQDNDGHPAVITEYTAESPMGKHV